MNSSRIIHLTPGPTELHAVAKEAIRDALDSDICSISHRSSEFEELLSNTETHLRALLSVPDGHRVYFLSSGTESWERIINNAVLKSSYHLINGSFSKRFFETAQELGKSATFLEKPLGQGFDLEDIPDSLQSELICVTQNETSTGVCLPDGFVEGLRKKHSEPLIAVDAVSSAPYPKMDLNAVDFYFFSVQKFFCLPAGLGVLIVSPRALQKADQLKKSGISIGAHHSLPSLESYAKKHQTPTTPNVLGIYALGIMAEHLGMSGIEQIRAETDQKAALLYKHLDSPGSRFSAFVTESRWRSKTVITVKSDQQTSSISKTLSEKGLIVGQGYGKLKDSQFRVANFCAHGIDDFNRLIAEL